MPTEFGDHMAPLGGNSAHRYRQSLYREVEPTCDDVARIPHLP